MIQMLFYIGVDSWGRPVYSDEHGNLWKDINPRSRVPPDICSVVGNEFEGEPNSSIKYEFKLLPSRVTW